MSSTPGVVLKSRFVIADSKAFNDYVEYMDRDDVTLSIQMDKSTDDGSEFEWEHRYLDYMGDEEKQGSLFTNYSNEIDDIEKQSLKKAFALAQDKGSPLWQDVISFDNNWLAVHGFYNLSTGRLDEGRLKNVVRESVAEMLRAEKMDSAIWTAAIHFNTDNIHVHVATVETSPTREVMNVYNHERSVWEEQYRAKRKQSSLDKMKSKVANLIADRSQERNRINDLIRGAVADKKTQKINVSVFNQMGREFQKALQKMPSDKRQWMYAYQTVDEARPHIDKIVELYLEKHHKEEMKELNLLLDQEVEVMKSLYGENSNYKRYKETKLQDLKKRMGNAVIQEMKNYEQTYFLIGKDKISNAKRFNWKRKGELHFAIRQLNYRMRKTYQDYQKDKNLEEFDRMLDGRE